METAGQADAAGKVRMVIEAWDAISGTPQRLLTDGAGKLQIAGTLSGGGDGAIVDGVTPSIRASVLTAAPVSDTGQPALAVRVISQLGAGTGGGGGNLATAAKGTTAAGSPTSENTNANIQALHVNVVNFPATQPISAVSLPLPTGAATETTLAAVNTKLAGTIAVSGTFWQATQPVSLATNTPDVTDRAARLLGHVTVDNASLAVTMATQTPDVTDRDARLLGRAKILDSAGAVIDPALKGQLPAALVGGRLSVDASGVAVPVTDNAGSLTVDAPVGTPVFVTATPSTTGGWSPASLTALLATKTAVKAGAGTMGGYMFYNPNASVVYIQVWDVAIGSITVGTTAPTYVIPIPAGSAANVEFTNGIKHATEINVAATTTPTGSTAPGTALTGFMLFK